MEMLEIEKLTQHPRNKEFFDDIHGDRWEDFKKSIKNDGVINPVVITQDLVIVSGHQRVKACKELGLKKVSCVTIHYPDYDDKLKRTKEDMILENLISTNIMQRGVGNVNPMKMAKCIVELERIKGIKNGNNQHNKGSEIMPIKTQKSLSDCIGLDERQLRSYKKLNTLIPELQEMIEDNDLKATVGYKIWAKMPQEEQEKFFNEIGREKIKTLTQKATQQYLDENNRLKEELQREKNKPREKEVVERVVEIDNTDYTIQKKYEKMQEYHQEIKNERDRLERRLKNAEELAEAYKSDSKEYKKMKEEITYLTQQKDEMGRRVQSVTELSGLIVSIKDFLKNKLAPIRYSESLLEAKDEEIVKNNLRDIISVVESWVVEMKQYVPSEENYVEVIR